MWAWVQNSPVLCHACLRANTRCLSHLIIYLPLYIFPSASCRWIGNRCDVCTNSILRKGKWVQNVSVVALFEYTHIVMLTLYYFYLYGFFLWELLTDIMCARGICVRGYECMISWLPFYVLYFSSPFLRVSYIFPFLVFVPPSYPFPLHQSSSSVLPPCFIFHPPSSISASCLFSPAPVMFAVSSQWFSHKVARWETPKPEQFSM